MIAFYDKVKKIDFKKKKKLINDKNKRQKDKKKYI